MPPDSHVLITSISVTASSQLSLLEAHSGGKLSKIEIWTKTINHIDVHSNPNLRWGTIKICNGYNYSNGSSSNTYWKYTNGSNLEKFIAYGCGINYSTNDNNVTHTYLLGDGIPGNYRMIYFKIVNDIGKDVAITTYHAKFHYGGNKGADRTNEAYNSTSVFDYSGDCQVEGNIDWNKLSLYCGTGTDLWVWSDNTKAGQHSSVNTIIVYPFGE